MPPVPSCRVASTRVPLTRRAIQAFLLIIAMLVPTLAQGVLGASAASPPTLTTDKLDYQPGEVVHLAGTGYDPGQTYAIPVRRPDTSILKGDGSFAPGWDTVVADGAGTIAYNYQLDGIGGLYEARTYAHPWSGSWSLAPIAAVTFTDALSVNLDQCANLTTPCTWQNGNLNQSNSAYAEGDVVPFRLAIEDLGPGVHTIHINYDFTAGGHEAYDFLATYNATETVNLCAAGGGGVSSLCPALPAPQQIPFQSDPFAVPDANNLTVAGAEAAAAGVTRLLTVYGATVGSVSVSVPTHAGPTDGNSTADIVVTFSTTGSSSAVLLAWGGHIASSSYWLEGTAPDGAGQISGAPWHMRTQQLDGAGNRNQDRSINPSAIAPPPGFASITVVKDTVPDGPTPFTFTPNSVLINGGANFFLDDDGTDTPFPNSRTFTVPAGSYSITEQPSAGFVFPPSIVCSAGGAIPAPGVASFTVVAGNSVTCTFTNTAEQAPTGRLLIQKDTIPDGPPPFSFTPTGFNSGNTFVLDDDAITATPNALGFTVGAGVPLTVTETRVTGFVLSNIVCTVTGGNDGPPLSAFVVDIPAGVASGIVGPNELVTCVFTNRQQGRIIIHKDTVPNDPQIFNYVTTGTGLSPFMLQDDGNELVGPFNTQTFDVLPGVFTVQEVLPVPPFTLTSLTCTDPQITDTDLATGLATIRLPAGETVECTFVNTRPGGGGGGGGGGQYGTDPRTLPEERPYDPAPGSQPAGDTGKTGGTQDQPSASPDPGAEVAGTTVPVSAAPSDESGNPVVEAAIDAVSAPVNLPRTGAEIIQQAIAGLILVGGGLLLMALRRRRSSSTPA